LGCRWVVRHSAAGGPPSAKCEPDGISARRAGASAQLSESGESAPRSQRVFSTHEDLDPMVPRAGRAAGLVAGPGRRGRVAVVRRPLSALREARAPPATRELPGGRSSSVRAHRLKGRQAASNANLLNGIQEVGGSIPLGSTLLPLNSSILAYTQLSHARSHK